MEEQHVKGTSRGNIGVEMAKEFLTIIKEEFVQIDVESTNIGKLRLLEQKEKTVEEHVQILKKKARGSRYKGRVFIGKLKRSLNKGVRKRLI